jgi:hypothetical protein
MYLLFTFLNYINSVLMFVVDSVMNVQLVLSGGQRPQYIVYVQGTNMQETP